MTIKTTKATKIASLALITIALATGCSKDVATKNAENQNSGNTTATTVVEATTETAPATENTPEPVVTPEAPIDPEQTFTLESATMQNRAYTDSNIHPYRFQEGDTQDSADNGRVIARNRTYDGLEVAAAGESHTTYKVTITYTMRSSDGKITTRTAERDKVNVVADAKDGTATVTATSRQVQEGDITLHVPGDLVTVNGKVNLRDVLN
jgi:hypothetical protein